MPTPQRRRTLLGGGGFDPRTLGNLALWLDASRITGLNDGDAIATWSDLSGNNNDAAQSTAGKKPTFKTGILNGKPVVRFDGGDGLATPSIDFSATAQTSVFVVVNVSGAGALQMIIELTAGLAAPYWHVRRDSTDKAGSYIVGDVGQNSFQATGTLSGNAHVIASIFDQSLASNETNQWVDGSAAGSRGANTNNSGNFQSGVVYIGARAATSLYFVGDIAEIIVYATDRTAVRPQIEAYLRSKWGTP